MTNIAIFASGGGSNANAICRYFDNHPSIKIVIVVSNRMHAGVHEVAQMHNIPSITFKIDDWKNPIHIIEYLNMIQVDFIILAGFLIKIPTEIIECFPERIINIHPSLLPKYGGRGMYGHHVHQAVFDNKEQESGITIHVVNEQYDKGKIIFQTSREITSLKNPEEIAQKILQLEHHYYPLVIENYVQTYISGELRI